MEKMSTLLSQLNKHLLELDLAIENTQKTSFLSQEIKQAHIYPLSAGGKRVRPLLTLLAAAALGGQRALLTAYQPALAVEMIHTYTLVHDDLPCMDNDDLRRGRPTTHKVYGEAKALLVGDGLLAQAFLTLCQTNWQQKRDYGKELFEILAQAAGPAGVIWGQWLDLSLTNDNQTNWELMEIVHTYKTGVLIGASLEMGFLCGLSQRNEAYSESCIQKWREKIKKIGHFIGLTFQIIDDILDETKTTQELGKTAGKDKSQNKYTAPRLLGRQKAEDLSIKYTDLALSLLAEVLADINDSQKNFQNHEKDSLEYQSLLQEQIQNLLSRAN